MKERPILFSGAMVRAILDGRKTMTRRVIKAYEDANLPGWHFAKVSAGLVAGWQYGKPIEPYMGIVTGCPYGQPGDRLWVRETWACSTIGIEHKRGDWVRFRATDGEEMYWRPSIHMPRWASRLTLEIVGVKVERLQDISEEDIKAEGFDRIQYRGYTSAKIDDPEDFSDAWDAMNAKRGYSWASNPWVWAITFKRIEP